MPTKKTVEVVSEGDEVVVTDVTAENKLVGTGVYVARKIQKLRDKIKEIKPQKMEQYKMKYNYLAERDMTLTIRPVMQELGLVAVPIRGQRG